MGIFNVKSSKYVQKKTPLMKKNPQTLSMQKSCS